MKNRKAMVTIYVIRHGQKGPGDNDLAHLTGEGRVQVIQSAVKNLKNIKFDALYCSQKYRALETVVLATSVLPNRNNGLSVISDIGFDYSGAPNLDEYAQYCAQVKQIAKDRNTDINMAIWGEVAPELINFLRNRFSETLKKVAIKTSEEGDSSEYNILVGSHSPTSELGCVDMHQTTPLKEADVMRYLIEVKKIEGYNDIEYVSANIIASKNIDRGF